MNIWRRFRGPSISLEERYPCICPELLCFCSDVVEKPFLTCDLCRAGHHVWGPGNERE